MPDVPELECYIKCLLEHAGVMEEDGTVDLANLFFPFFQNILLILHPYLNSYPLHFFQMEIQNVKQHI